MSYLITYVQHFIFLAIVVSSHYSCRIYRFNRSGACGIPETESIVLTRTYISRLRNVDMIPQSYLITYPRRSGLLHKGMQTMNIWMYVFLSKGCLTHWGLWWKKMDPILKTTQIAKFMGPTWGPPGSCRPQMGPMLAPWTLLSGLIDSCNFVYTCHQFLFVRIPCTYL